MDKNIENSMKIMMDDGESILSEIIKPSSTTASAKSVPIASVTSSNLNSFIDNVLNELEDMLSDMHIQQFRQRYFVFYKKSLYRFIKIDILPFIPMNEFMLL